MSERALTIRSARTRTVAVPMRRALITRIIEITTAPLVLIDLDTEEGVSGQTYLFGYTRAGCAYLEPLVNDLVAALAGQRLAPDALYDRAVKTLTMFGHEGLALMAVSGLDMAYWDALAKAEGKPLVECLGGRVEPVPAYNSCALGIIGPDEAAAEARELLAEGDFDAVKVRLGRERLEDDIAVIRAVRDAVGADIALPVDFNQCLDVDEAIRRGRALDAEGVFWIEEPIRYDNMAGNARIAAEVETPIQNGENFYGPDAAGRAIEAGALDLIMPDVERIGGVTGWMRTAELARAANLPISSHLFPEVSRHLLAASPTQHWLEYVDWAAPILENPVTIRNGNALIDAVPGTGIAWNEDAVGRYAFDA